MKCDEVKWAVIISLATCANRIPKPPQIIEEDPMSTFRELANKVPTGDIDDVIRAISWFKNPIQPLNADNPSFREMRCDLATIVLRWIKKNRDNYPVGAMKLVWGRLFTVLLEDKNVPDYDQVYNTWKEN